MSNVGPAIIGEQEGRETMANLIGWPEVEASVSAAKGQQACDTRSQALVDAFTGYQW